MTNNAKFSVESQSDSGATIDHIVAKGKLEGSLDGEPLRATSESDMHIRGTSRRAQDLGDVRYAPTRVGILVTPQVSLFSLLALAEPLRTVNRLTGRWIYDIQFLSIDGADVTASNDLIVPVAASLCDRHVYDLAFVVTSYQQPESIDIEICRWLHFQNSHNAIVGGVDIGVVSMANAGLLEGRKAAVHWELIPSVKEKFTNLDIAEELYCFENHRMTSGGFTATLDMMLVFVYQRHGSELATAIANEMLVTVVRDGSEPQRTSSDAEPWARHSKVARIVDVMNSHLENPKSIKEIAEECDISIGKFGRLTKKHLNLSPYRLYLDLRLRKSRELILYSDMTMTQIALACGFSSSPTFARAFHAHFLISPTEYRNRYQRNISRPYISPTNCEQVENGLFPYNGCNN